jgi:Carboxypeptidase regulatory-like domain
MGAEGAAGNVPGGAAVYRAMRRSPSVPAPALFLVLVSTALVAAGCRAPSTPAGGGGSGGGQGVAGTVVLGPMCPVERLDSPCPDRPIAATVVVDEPSGSRAASVRTGRDGAFSIPLGPGRYRVTAFRPGGMQYAKPVQVTVRDGAWTRVVVQVDSGIR